MKRKKGPLELVDAKDEEAKAKVSVVLEVLSGEKSIAEACRETDIKPLAYYKLEERMVTAMLEAAKMPAGRGKRRNPMAEATTLAEETEELRQEHRRMKSLLRVTKKLFRRAGKMRKRGPGRPKGATSPEMPIEGMETAPRRPGRPPLSEKAQA